MRGSDSMKKYDVSKIMWSVIQIFNTFLFVTPLLWMVVSSFKLESEIFKDMTSIKSLFLSNPTLDNYKEMFNRVPIFLYIMNSFIYISVIVIAGLFVNSLAGYALARLEFPFKKMILALIIALYIIPFETVLLPLFLVINKLGLVNTREALYLPFIANVFNIFLFRQFFMNFPREIEEAAEIDGASPFQIFLRIILPSSKPIMATSIILTVVSHWGDFTWPLIATNDEGLRNVQLGIQSFFTAPPVHYGPIMAALVFTTLPMIIIFLLFQKYYVQGVTSSGVKG